MGPATAADTRSGGVPPLVTESPWSGEVVSPTGWQAWTSMHGMGTCGCRARGSRQPRWRPGDAADAGIASARGKDTKLNNEQIIWRAYQIVDEKVARTAGRPGPLEHAGVDLRRDPSGLQAAGERAGPARRASRADWTVPHPETTPRGLEPVRASLIDAPLREGFPPIADFNAEVRGGVEFPF